MGKFILALYVTCLLFLGVGTAKSPGDAMFWLASGSQLFQIVRASLIMIILVQIITNPPRHLLLRLISGVVSMVVGVWTVQATLASTMPAMDTFVFFGTSVALLITALERRLVTTFVAEPA